MKHLKIPVAVLLAVLIALGLPVGCQSRKEEETSSSGSEEFLVEDPFDTGDTLNGNILGELGHGPVNPVFREDGTLDAYEYNGGQFELEYQVTASGTAKNVGFLLFLDGIPQPYRVDGQGDADYMHMFELEEDDREYLFSFVFTPVIGSAGDTRQLKIYSVYYPQFQPDMVTSSSYGMYYSILEMALELAFREDAAADGANAGAQTVSALSAVTVTSEDMTGDFVNSRLNSGFTVEGQSEEDLLEDSVYSFIEYDGKTVYDNLDVSNQDTVHITYQMVGRPGAVYRVTLYANNHPMTDGEAISWELTLSRGQVVTLEADIDVSALADLTTFYVMACPVDTGAAESIEVGKITRPILLYREGESLAAQGLMDSGEIRNIDYGSAGTLLLRTSDTLYWYDADSGSILAQRPTDDWLSVDYYPIEGGLCAIGTSCSDSTGGFAATYDSTLCVFYDEALRETDRIALNELGAGADYIMCAAVSDDGTTIAYSTQDKLYCYDRASGTLAMVLDLSYDLIETNDGLCAISDLIFSPSGDKLLFCGNSFALPLETGQHSDITFGAISLDGSGFQNLSFQSFTAGSMAGAAGGYLFFEESMLSGSGKVAVVDGSDMSQTLYALGSVREGEAGVYYSQTGGYFATAELGSNQLTVRIYRRDTGAMVCTQTIEDTNEAYFYRMPGIYLLDGQGICIVKLGGFNDIPSRVVRFSL